ncbi:ABC transporter permease [Paenibacillus sp. YPG26]|uniref:ABC transporter permease n=1 Tax=Paenibacillus sp. YPG26 TaxID=2878915 RepID=UPI00203CDFC1|nr:ABC transporter permease [Paenibacillus sp. YPG26]USB33463.1 ABC transporter permease [Paenibacillus sp. YPG26]
MIGRALSSDFLKIRGKGIWFLIFIAPIGLVVMQALNFGLRYDYLIKQYQGHLWEGLITNMMGFVPLALFMGSTLVSSMLAGVEHQLSSWKQLLALPISRTAVFISKFLLSLILMAVACLLLSVGTAVLGLCLGFGSPLPWSDLAKIGFYPFIGSLPLLALQLYLSLTYKNQALPVTLGLALAICSLFTGSLSEWFPLNWPALAYRADNQLPFLGAGFALSLLILIFALLHFNRKDVN